MIWFLVLLLLMVAGMVVTGYRLSVPRYAGPRSDHFDGRRFRNAGGAQARGLGAVLWWMLSRHRGAWPAGAAPVPGPPPSERVPGGDLRITFINHTTFLIQTEGLNILTDPVWSERVSPFSFAGPRRRQPPGLRFRDLPPIDMVLLSHNHYDHLDVSTLRRLAYKHRPRIATPLGVRQFLEEKGISGATDMDWGKVLPVHERLRIACVPAQHFSGRGLFDRDATLWCGYVLLHPRGNIYFAGDTGYGPIFTPIGEQYGPMRLAILPIGAYKPEWFMSPIHVSPAQAVQIHLDVRAARSIASHFGTFQLADDGKSEPVEDLRKALREKNLPEDAFIVPEEGKGIDV
jgi:L-ascorbate metabolism protein UlaG (beta-lactamase superfamily)